MSHVGTINTKKNNRIAILIAVVFHVAILLICWFWVAWMRPIPPEVMIPEGVTVGFGGGQDGGGTDELTSAAAPLSDPNAVVDPSEDIPDNTPQPTEPTQPAAPVVSGSDPAPVNTSPPTPTPPAPIRSRYPPRNPGTGTAPTGTDNSGGGPNTGGGSGNTNGPGPGGNGNGTGGIEGSVSGWKWKSKPNPQPCASNYTGSGSVTFRITLSLDGKIDEVVPEKSNLPKSIEDCIRETVRTQAQFQEIGDNTENSSGKITITLKY